MLSDQQCSRIDTLELKLQIVKNLGKRKAAKYFKNLEGYLTLKINKQQFQKRCYSTIGNENSKLHNCLINAILGNARLANAKQTQPASQTQSDHDTKLSKEKKTCTEVVSVGTKAPSMNIRDANESQEKRIGNEEISIYSKAPSMNFREAYESKEKQAGSEVISVGSKALSVNVQEAQKSREKQGGTEVVSVGNEAPTVNVPEAYNPQEEQDSAELISMNSESLSLNDLRVWELQVNQIVSDSMSTSIEAPSREPEEKQIGPGLTTIYVNVQEVCMSPQKSQKSPEVISLGSKPVGDVVLLEDEEGTEKGRGSLFVQSRSPIRPPQYG